MPLGNGVVLIPLLPIEPLAPEAPLPPEAPDALPLVVVAPVDDPDPVPDVAIPEEMAPLMVPEVAVPLPPLAGATVLVPEAVALPEPVPVVLDVPEPEEPLPEPTIVGPAAVPHAQSPMARRPRYPNQRIFRDLSDDFITPERGGRRIAPAQSSHVKVSGFSTLSRLSDATGLLQRERHAKPPFPCRIEEEGYPLGT
jgi:hypothetical protein